jgi:hypothetical protein
MEIPVYDRNDEPNAYFKKINKYLIDKKKDNYIIILNFINNWMKKYNKNIKILTEFTMFASYDMNDYTYNKQYLKDNIKNIELALNTDFNNITCIFIFIGKLLNIINYNLKKKLINNIIYYSIVEKL